MNEKGKTEKMSVIHAVICFIICIITLFVTSQFFVDLHTTPKWLCLMLFIGILGIIRGCLFRSEFFPANPIDVIITVWFFLAFFRSSGSSAIYPAGLLLLYLLIRSIGSMETKFFQATVIAFSFILSAQGILQYVGVLSSTNKLFAVTGCFDNPAGFASALTCIFPVCFLFQRDRSPYFRHASVASASVIAIAVFLSGSRTGMMAILLVAAVWFFINSLTKKSLAKFTVVSVLIILSIALYFFKRDSADGRLLIWRCSMEMIADKPIFGHGQGAFQTKYMQYQATYLDAHPDCRYAQLADNTIHPFNEYLLVLCEQGLVVFSTVVLMAFLLVRAYRRNRNDETLVALLCLLALAIFSFFSYPFKYPFSWLMLLLNIYVICKSPIAIHSLTDNSDITNRQTKYKRGSLATFVLHDNGNLNGKAVKQYGIFLRTFVLLLAAGLLTGSIILTRAEIKWNRIASVSISGKIREVLPEYDRLHRWLGKDGFFLYNHAAILYEAREFERSLAVTEQCIRHYNDMDVQMLLADNFRALKKLEEAEKHYKKAASMCPSRFMPLYELVKLYEANDRKDDALALAKKIIEKDVKIPSITVSAIKNEMQKRINAKEASDVPETVDSRASEESENNEKRQGEMLEGAPHCTALPP